MRLRSVIIPFAVLSLGATLAPAQQLPATGAGADQPPAPTAPAPDFPVEQMLEVYGWFLGEQMQVYAFGLSDEEIEALNRGVALAARGLQPDVDLEKVGPALQAFLQTRPDEVFARRTEQGRAEEQQLFAELDARPEVKKTASGLRYEILDPGTGPKPAFGDTIVAHYTGTFVDGTVFDTSRDRGEPAEFQLSNVIEGWQEGLQLIGKGGHIKLYIPAALAYGETGNRNIPPSKPLIFDVELLDVKPPLPAAGSTSP